MRVIYQSLGDKKWHLAQLRGDFTNGTLVLSDGSTYPMRGVNRDAVKPFTALGSVEYIRLLLGIPEKMPLDLTGEWELEGFRYKLFSAKEAMERKKTKGRLAQRFFIWCEVCEAWIPAGRRAQEKHLRPLWLFKAIAEAESR